MSNPIEMTVWPGDYGLVSMNCECIRMVSYMKFGQVPFKLKYDRNPCWYSKGEFPLFRDGSYTIEKFSDAVEHLRFNRYSLDFGISSKCCSEMMALIELTVKMLKPALEYVMWLDKRNYEELTRPWYTKTMPVFLNILYTIKRRRQAQNLIDVYFPQVEDNNTLQSYIKKQVAECLAILTLRLENQDYFYGNAPTSLDCLIYSYLAPLIKIPWPSNEIANLVNGHPKLLDYIKRIDNKYFPEVKIKTTIVSKQVDRIEDIGASIKLKFCTLIFVSCALLGYAISNKILIIKSKSDSSY